MTAGESQNLAMPRIAGRIQSGGESVVRKTQAVWSRFSVISVSVLVTLTAVSGCGEGREREYAVPRSLCGTPVVASDLARFLPPGKEISVSGSDRSDMKRCEVFVDDVLIVTTMQVWLEEGWTTRRLASGLSFEEINHSAEGGRFWYGGNEAYGKTRSCVDVKHKQKLYTAFQAGGSDYEDADAMNRIILAYTREVERSAECTEGAYVDYGDDVAKRPRETHARVESGMQEGTGRFSTRTAVLSV